jgi:colanic acid biosynthesis glycosyl transferase WcaI
MRILINDFGGYPFPVQLSKFLSNNGYDVVHTYVSNIQTPHGNMEAGFNGLKIIPVVLNSEFKKYSFTGRFKGEYEYARKAGEIIESFKPDIFLSANTPLLAQGLLLKKCKRSNIKFIYWCQDIHSIAIESYLKTRLPLIGKYLSAYFKWKEIKLLEQSDHVITIADSFNRVFEAWKISQKHISVIHNWGPIADIMLKPKSNEWSKKLGVDTKLVVLYSGTLGLKHNPELISKAAKNLQEDAGVVFIVISEGIGAEMLRKEKEDLKLDNLIILPYQDYALLPEVLGSADILLSILEKGAALFSVPSKVLTYLCAQKAIVLSVPGNNLSAKIVTDTNSGYCFEPDDVDGFIEGISTLLINDELRKTMGHNGRKYAEDHFEIAHIAEKFIKIFNAEYN